MQSSIIKLKGTDKILKSAKNKSKLLSNENSKTREDPFSQKIIDSEWDILESSIRSAANKFLSKKCFTAAKTKESNENHSCDLCKLFKQLNKLCRKGKKSILNAKDKEDLENVLIIIKTELDEEFFFEDNINTWLDNTYEHLEQLAQLVKTV